MVDRGEVPDSYGVKVLERGIEILVKNRLPITVTNETGTQASWEDWRLVVNGREYPPKFKSFEEWSSYYDSQ